MACHLAAPTACAPGSQCISTRLQGHAWSTTPPQAALRGASVSPPDRRGAPGVPLPVRLSHTCSRPRPCPWLRSRALTPGLQGEVHHARLVLGVQLQGIVHDDPCLLGRGGAQRSRDKTRVSDRDRLSVSSMWGISAMPDLSPACDHGDPGEGAKARHPGSDTAQKAQSQNPWCHTKWTSKG